MKRRVLNVGCGKRLEIGTDWIDYAPQDPRVLKVDVNREKFPYRDGTFDEVYSRHVVEFLSNPENFFSESRRVLKKGGTMTLFVPNATGVDTIIGHNAGYWLKDTRTPRHIPSYLIFTKPILRNWLVRYGFTDIKMDYLTTKATEPSIIFKLHRIGIKTVSGAFPKLNSQIRCVARKGPS